MRRFFHGRLWSLQMGVVLIALLAMACSLPAGPGPTATPDPTATPQPTPTAVPQPTPTPVVSPPPNGQRGGSLTVAASADVPHRDVHQELQETLTTLGPGLAYSRLLRLRTGPQVEQPSLLLECDLCQSWELMPDFSYEFRLRPGVHWQNIDPVNGRALVAQDLVYSYERMQTPGWPNAAIFTDRGIAGFAAPDDSTLRVNLSFLDSDALFSLADGRSKIVAREVVEQYGDLKDSPVVGTGPWVWQETTPGVGTTLSRHPDYFEGGLPFLDRLDIKVIKSSGLPASTAKERLAALQANLVDVATLPPQEWQQLYSSNRQFSSLVAQRAGSGMLLSINVQAPPMDDVVVRRAVLKALDPWEYIDLMRSGQGSVGVGLPTAEPDWLLSRDEMRGGYLANPAEARDLLVSTGRDLPLDVELTVAEFGDVYVDLGRRMAAELTAVGFNAGIRGINPSHYNEMLLGEQREYQILLGAMPPSTTANGFLLTLLHSSGPVNISRHQDATLDALIQEQAGELDPEQRRAQLAEVQHHVLDQGYLFSPIMDSSRWVFARDVQGFHPNAGLSEYSYWSRAWLQR
jgi:peptide/nickel transport system substrate-binding protein